MHDWQDDDALAQQYTDASKLAARQALHARFCTADRSLHEWLFDQFDLPADASVLSLGAGVGTLWAINDDRVPAAWDVTVTDNSSGMVMDAMEALEDCDRDYNFDVVDARDIPYPDDAFDAVTANHMLYHLDDAGRETALSEIRRVLEPSGTLYASTNGDRNLAELFEVAREFGPVPDELGFSLQNGTDQLREHFDTVERRRFDTELRVTTHEPLVAYVLSMPGFDEEDAMDIADAFRAKMGDDGEDSDDRDDGEDSDDGLQVTKDVGVFVASAER